MIMMKIKINDKKKIKIIIILFSYQIVKKVKFNLAIIMNNLLIIIKNQLKKFIILNEWKYNKQTLN